MDADGPSGSRLLVEEAHDLPLVRLGVTLRTGGGDDPPELDGLANFATELMARGAGGKTRARIDEALDALGAHLSISTNYDGSHFEVTALRDRVDEVMALVCSVLLSPDFPADEADKLRREIESQLDELREDDGSVARRFMARRLYGAKHPYGLTLTGTSASLPRLTVQTARAWHERAVRGPGLVFHFAGDIAADEAQALVGKYAGRVPAGGTFGQPYPTPRIRTGTRFSLADKPERTQSQILYAHVAPSWRDPMFDPLQVGVHAFGGTFTSRLMDEVRVKRGLSYGTSARVGYGRGQRSLTMTVAPSLEQTAETVALMRGLYRSLAQNGLTQAELDFAKVNLRESFAFNLATPEDRLDVRITSDLVGQPEGYVASFPQRVAAVTLEQVNAALASLRPDDLEIVIVTTAEELRPRLEAAGLLKDAEVEVVAYDED